MKIKFPGINTKTIILDRAKELINEVGLADFRVDVLAASLLFSTGNVTYHFRKKEDIVNSLWDVVVDNIDDTYSHYVSSILDIKQLYVFLRALANDNISYVGVIAYKLGDVACMSKMEHNSISYGEFLYGEYMIMIKYLIDNGCLNKKDIEKYKYLTFNTQMTLFCWWLNNEFKVVEGKNTNNIADRFAIAVIHPLIPFMTEEGLRQFNSIRVRLKIL